MPEFCLNTPSRGHAFHALDDFCKGYVEAMFFTNGDTGDEREWLLNDWGVDRLTCDSVAAIKRDCDKFRASLPKDELDESALDRAINADPYSYTDEQAGRDFWFSRQGHAVGYFEIPDEALRDELLDAAQRFGEANVEAYRGWIYHH